MIRFWPLLGGCNWIPDGLIFPLPWNPPKSAGTYKCWFLNFGISSLQGIFAASNRSFWNVIMIKSSVSFRWHRSTSRSPGDWGRAWFGERCAERFDWIDVIIDGFSILIFDTWIIVYLYSILIIPLTIYLTKTIFAARIISWFPIVLTCNPPPPIDFAGII